MPRVKSRLGLQTSNLRLALHEHGAATSVEASDVRVALGQLLQPFISRGGEWGKHPSMIWPVADILKS
jgi:hypothetical protein